MYKIQLLTYLYFDIFLLVPGESPKVNKNNLGKAN